VVEFAVMRQLRKIDPETFAFSVTSPPTANALSQVPAR
jgi:hypothetical protein